VPAKWRTKVPLAERRRGDGRLVADFVGEMCRQTKDTIAGSVGESLALRKWQRDMMEGLFARRADGRRRFRRALIGVPRKNGKSAISSGVALAELFLTGPDGGEIYSCAADRDQARIVFGMAKRMVELEPELSAGCKLYRDAIECHHNGSVYRVLSAEAFTKEGLNPSLVIFDEVHAQPTDELWNVMSLASGSRLDPLLLGITTAGVRHDRFGEPTLCYRLWEHGRATIADPDLDPSFFFEWWSAPDRADYRDPKVWKAANPAYGDIVAVEDFEASVLSTPENEYRTKRLNQWVSSAQAWLPGGAWEALEVAGQPSDGDEVVLAFDGSRRNDSTALVGCRIGDPSLFVVDCWEKDTEDPDWRVPVPDVQRAVDEAFRRWDVRRMVCDPWGWDREISEWRETWGEEIVLDFPPNRQRMIPACRMFYEGVMEGFVKHDGSEVLARHLRNCVTKATAEGDYIVKEVKTRKIDAAVAAVMAFQQAVLLEDEPPVPGVYFAST
jgi:phage terminase large subunit-like protein